MNETVKHQWSHVLLDLYSQEDLQAPIRSSSRVKYSCIGVSNNYLAIGASTGGIYIFNRESLKCILHLPSQKEGSVELLKFGPDDTLLASATSKGHVRVVELDISRGRHSPVRMNNLHQGHLVTSLEWSENNTQLFVGDDVGRVSLVNIPFSKTDYLLVPCEFILTLESRVVQLSIHMELLLVSTMTRCYLCATVNREFNQIGKQLRDGEFGATFFQKSNEKFPVVYCARPRSRMWEATTDGLVRCTHQFKDLLAIPSMPIVKPKTNATALSSLHSLQSPQIVNFQTIYKIGFKYLLMVNSDSLFIIDPVVPAVILWTNEIKDVMKLACCQNDIYILQSDCKVRRISLSPIVESVKLLINAEYWLSSVALLQQFLEIITPTSARTILPYDSIEFLRSKLEELDLFSECKIVNRILIELEVPDIETDHSQVQKTEITHLVNKSAKYDSFSNNNDACVVETSRASSDENSNSKLMDLNDLLSTDPAVMSGFRETAQNMVEINLSDDFFIDSTSSLVHENDSVITNDSNSTAFVVPSTVSVTHPVAKPAIVIPANLTLQRRNLMNNDDVLLSDKRSRSTSPKSNNILLNSLVKRNDSASPSLPRNSSSSSLRGSIFCSAVDDSDVPLSVRGMSRSGSYSSLNSNDIEVTETAIINNVVSGKQKLRKNRKAKSKLVEFGAPKSAPVHLRGRATSETIATKKSREFVQKKERSDTAFIIKSYLEKTSDTDDYEVPKRSPKSTTSREDSGGLKKSETISSAGLDSLIIASHLDTPFPDFLNIPINIKTPTKEDTMKVMNDAKDKLHSKTKKFIGRLKETIDPMVDTIKAELLETPTKIIVFEESRRKTPVKLSGQDKKKDLKNNTKTKVSPQMDSVLADLKIVTESTRKKLKICRIALDPGERHRLLQAWMISLNETLHQFRQRSLTNSLQEFIVAIAKEKRLHRKRTRNSSQTRNSLTSSDTSKNITMDDTASLLNSYNREQNTELQLSHAQSNGDPLETFKDQSSLEIPSSNDICIYCKRQQILKRSFSKVIYLDDPLGMDDHLLSECKYLANLCFSLRIHGNVCFYLERFCDVFADCDCTCPSFGESSHSNNHDESSQGIIELDENSNVNCDKISDSLLPFHDNIHSDTDSASQASFEDMKNAKIICPGKPSNVSSDTNSLSSEKFGSDGNDNDTDVSDGCHADKELASLVMTYNFLFDFEKMRNIISNQNSDNRKIWKAFIKCLEARHKPTLLVEQCCTSFLESKPSKVLLKNLRQHPAALVAINSCFLSNAEKVVEMLVELYPSVNSADVRYLCESHDQPSRLLSHYLRTAWLKYAPRDRYWTDLGRNRAIFELYLQAVLSDCENDRNILMCDCGMPRPFSHTSFEGMEVLETMLAAVSVNQSIADLCWHSGYWYGWLKHCRRFSTNQLRIEVLLQLGDIEFLKKTFQADGVLKSMAVWETLLTLKERQARNCDSTETWHCLKCDVPLVAIPLHNKHSASFNLIDNTSTKGSDSSVSEKLVELKLLLKDSIFGTNLVTWAKLSELLLGIFDVKVTLEILSCYAIPENGLDVDFYRSCIYGFDKQ